MQETFFFSTVESVTEESFQGIIPFVDRGLRIDFQDEKWGL